MAEAGVEADSPMSQSKLFLGHYTNFQIYFKKTVFLKNTICIAFNIGEMNSNRICHSVRLNTHYFDVIPRSNEARH